MDILGMIKKDHTEFRRQLKTLVETATNDHDKSTKIFRSLHDHLVAHHEAEERVLFDKLKQYADAKDTVEEGWEEHEAIGLYLEKIKRSHKTVRWEAKASVLKELVEHHLEEEEDQLFKAARRHLGAQLVSLGERFEADKERRLSK